MNENEPAVEFFVGVDLAQSVDYTAICVLEVTRAWRGWDGWGHLVDTPIPETEQRHTVVHLDRFERGTPYPEMVRDIKQLVQSIPRAGRGFVEPGLAKVNLVVDKTGVGAAVVDLFDAAGLNPIPITITGGDEVTDDWPGFRVPKRDLVSKIKILQQQRRLQVVQSLPLAGVLTKEMQNFKYKLSLKGHDSYGAGQAPEWRDGAHDDLVLSVALACWAADNNTSRQAVWAPAPDWLLYGRR